MNNNSPKSALILMLGVLSIIGLFPLGFYVWIKGKPKVDQYPNDKVLRTGYILGILSSCLLMFYVTRIFLQRIF